MSQACYRATSYHLIMCIKILITIYVYQYYKLSIIIIVTVATYTGRISYTNNAD